jgi:hypothetical protein
MPVAAISVSPSSIFLTPSWQALQRRNGHRIITAAALFGFRNKERDNQIIGVVSKLKCPLFVASQMSGIGFKVVASALLLWS